LFNTSGGLLNQIWRVLLGKVAKANTWGRASASMAAALFECPYRFDDALVLGQTAGTVLGQDRSGAGRLLATARR
jgi:hypothetical protein